MRWDEMRYAVDMSFSWEMYYASCSKYYEWRQRMYMMCICNKCRKTTSKMKNNCTVEQLFKRKEAIKRKSHYTIRDWLQYQVTAVCCMYIDKNKKQNKSYVSVAQLLYCMANNHNSSTVQGIWNLTEIRPTLQMRCVCFVYIALGFFFTSIFPELQAKRQQQRLWTTTTTRKRHQANIWIMLINISIF